MNSKKKTNIIIAIIMAATLVITLIVYPSMPDIVPTHWGPTGEIDGTGPKYFAFMGVAVAALVNRIMLFAEKIEPKQGSYDKFRKVFDILRVLVTVLMCGLQLLTIAFAFNPDFANMNAIMYPAMGVMLIVLGNYMPKVKHNYTFGIKTPWTYASEAVWNKTHRMCGPLWVAGGLAMAVLGFIKNTNIARVLLFVIMFTLVIIPMVYSYIEYKKEIPADEKNN